MPKFPRAELVQYMISTTNVHEGQSFELNLMEQTSSLQQRLEKLEAGEVSDVPHSLDDLYNCEYYFRYHGISRTDNR